MTAVFDLRAAPGSRHQEVRAEARMATPRRRMRYFSDRGEWEVVEPDRDRFSLDHPVVRRQPHLFRPVWNRFSRVGREGARLERELRAVERALASTPATPKTPTTTTTPPTTATPRTELFGPTGRRASHHIRRRTRAATWRI
jgi:hypothetical protein